MRQQERRRRPWRIGGDAIRGTEQKEILVDTSYMHLDQVDPDPEDISVALIFLQLSSVRVIQ